MLGDCWGCTKGCLWGGGECTARPGLGIERGGLLVGCGGALPLSSRRPGFCRLCRAANPRWPGDSVQAASLKIAPSPLPSCLSQHPLGSASSYFCLQLRLRASICLSPPSVCLSLPLPLTSPRKEGLAQAPMGFPAAASLGASPPLLVPGELSLLTSDAADCLHQFYGASVRAFRWTG